MDVSGNLELKATFPWRHCSKARALFGWLKFLFVGRLRKNKIKHLKRPRPAFHPLRVNGGASGWLAPAPAESLATKQTNDGRDRNRLCARPPPPARRCHSEPGAASACAPLPRSTPTPRPGDPPPSPHPHSHPHPHPAEAFLKLINETRFIYGPIPEQGLCKAFISSQNERMGRFKGARREKGEN